MPVLVPVINAESMSFLPCVLRHRILPTDWPARDFPHSPVIWREITPGDQRPWVPRRTANAPPLRMSRFRRNKRRPDLCLFDWCDAILGPHRIRVGTLIHFSHVSIARAPAITEH